MHNKRHVSTFRASFYNLKNRFTFSFQKIYVIVNNFTKINLIFHIYLEK